MYEKTLHMTTYLRKKGKKRKKLMRIGYFSRSEYFITMSNKTQKQ